MKRPPTISVQLYDLLEKPSITAHLGSLCTGARLPVIQNLEWRAGVQKPSLQDFPGGPTVTPSIKVFSSKSAVLTGAHVPRERVWTHVRAKSGGSVRCVAATHV